MLQRGLVTCGLLEGNERVDQVWTLLGIYGLLEDSMIVPKLDPGVHNLHGPRWLLEWQLLSSRVDKPKEQLSSATLVCGEGLI